MLSNLLSITCTQERTFLTVFHLIRCSLYVYFGLEYLKRLFTFVFRTLNALNVESCVKQL